PAPRPPPGSPARPRQGRPTSRGRGAAARRRCGNAAAAERSSGRDLCLYCDGPGPASVTAPRVPARDAPRPPTVGGPPMSEAHVSVIGLLLAWMAGIRAYLTVFGVGLAGLLGWVDLPPALQATQSWWVLGTAGALAVAEF